MLEYVRMLISLIEARAVSLTEIVQMLDRVLRQHSVGRRRKIDHALIWLQEHPPKEPARWQRRLNFPVWICVMKATG